VPIVINEWIIHELAGENGINAQSESASFLQSLHASSETIVVLRGSPWMTKAFNLMKANSPAVRILSQFLNLAILKNASKCRFIEQSEIQPLPNDLAAEVPADDIYLFQTAIAGNAEVIVTSDLRLIDQVKCAANLAIRLESRTNYLALFR
jgi:hypothetical protein